LVGIWRLRANEHEDKWNVTGFYAKVGWGLGIRKKGEERVRVMLMLERGIQIDFD